MNLCIGILLCFTLVGLADKILGGKLGVSEEMDRGLASMGGLCVSMSGIYCVAVTALGAVSDGVERVRTALPFDPSLLTGMLFAPDMGGWAAAKELAATPALAAYTGLLVASTLGCLISFTLPIALGSLRQHEVMGFMQGIVWGIVALPAGLVLGGLVVGLDPVSLFQNLWPVLALCGLVVAGLVFWPGGCIRALAVFGEAVRILGIVLFGVMLLGVFLPSIAFIPETLVQEALMIVFRIMAVVCGAMVASSIALSRCGGAIKRLADKLGVNEYAVLGCMASLVSTVSMLPLYGRMDVRGKVMNAAVSVSGAFLIGGQMAFVSSVGDSRSVAAFFVCKGLAGILAAALALRFTKNAPPEAGASVPEAA